MRKWLQRQEPYSLQRPVRCHSRRNNLVVAGIDDQWDADLMDMTKFKGIEWCPIRFLGHRYLFQIHVDAFSQIAT